MSAAPEHNEQLATRWADAARTRLVTHLERVPVPEPGPGDILVRPLWVPLHGSFWMAAHPEAVHPRIHEFMAAGRFVFGNGGVGLVERAGQDVLDAAPGDFVAVFGHIPCSRPDCEPCRVQGRYVECRYGESAILGHGKTAPDGMLASHCLLPAETWARCARAGEDPERLKPFMFAFLAADVRNALTRDPDVLGRRRVVIVGAGMSGRMAAWIILNENPRARVLGVDVVEENARALAGLDPDRARGVVLSPTDGPERLSREIRDFFGRPDCDLLMECSSGHTAPLWADRRVLGPGACCLLFGFGLEELRLDPLLLQHSGLKILTSRGVGTPQNRQRTVDLLRGRLGAFIESEFISKYDELHSLSRLEQLVAKNHARGTTIARKTNHYVSLNQDLAALASRTATQASS